MGIAGAEFRRNLADFDPVFMFRTARWVGLFEEMPVAITAQAEPDLPGCQPVRLADVRMSVIRLLCGSAPAPANAARGRGIRPRTAAADLRRLTSRSFVVGERHCQWCGPSRAPPKGASHVIRHSCSCSPLAPRSERPNPLRPDPQAQRLLHSWGESAENGELVRFDIELEFAAQPPNRPFNRHGPRVTAETTGRRKLES